MEGFSQTGLEQILVVEPYRKKYIFLWMQSKNNQFLLEDFVFEQNFSQNAIF
jgi:hypothetical protein